MKKSTLTALLLLPAMAWAQSGNFIVKAIIGAVSTPEMAYLIYNRSGQTIIDSAAVNKGSFVFEGTVAEPCNAQLILNHEGRGLNRLGHDTDINNFYLDKGDIVITAKDSVKNAVISGSEINNENANYEALIAKPEKALFSLNKAYNSASAEKQRDTAYTTNFQSEQRKFTEELKALKFDYIRKNPDSYISLETLKSISDGDLDVAVMRPMFESLSANVRGSVNGQNYAKALDIASVTAIGATAPDFTEYDANGKAVSLNDFRGKYVFLDFWASWCMPCRHENPNVVKAFNQYKTENFTVLGVSLDRPSQKSNWLAAIKSDGLEWTELDDFKLSPGQAVTKYRVSSVPQNYLIDPNGKIIAKNLRGDELSKKLAALFK